MLSALLLLPLTAFITYVIGRWHGYARGWSDAIETMDALQEVGVN